MLGSHEFLKALTVVLCVAALTTVIFQRLRQPVRTAALGADVQPPPLEGRQQRAALEHEAHAGLHFDGPAAWKSFLGVTGPATLPVAFEPGH